jgi:hypothetical protein
VVGLDTEKALFLLPKNNSAFSKRPGSTQIDITEQWSWLWHILIRQINPYFVSLFTAIAK